MQIFSDKSNFPMFHLKVCLIIWWIRLLSKPKTQITHGCWIFIYTVFTVYMYVMNLMVLVGLDPRSLASEAEVLTITPQKHNINSWLLNISWLLRLFNMWVWNIPSYRVLDGDHDAVFGVHHRLADRGTRCYRMSGWVDTAFFGRMAFLISPHSHFKLSYEFLFS